MPSEQQHLMQFLKNKMLIQDNELFSDIDNCGYLDWTVTIIFYSALHLLETKFAKKNAHFLGHKTREQYIASNFSKEIASKYGLLKMNSQKSRYKCFTFTPVKVKELREELNFIEELLKKAN